MRDPRFKTGARPSPRHKLLAAEPFRPVGAPPAQVAYVPKQLDMWGNNQYGDCVSAEEAFAKATYSPEIFIDAQTVENWAQQHGVLNGADLSEVLDWMAQKGFQVGSQLYNDGPKQGVDYSNETVLQSALAQGPVKIAIDANALPSGAGNQQGWYAVGGGSYPNTDHCVALCGYGPAEWLYQQLGVPLPSGLAGKQGYLLFTWSTIGFVDHAWLMGTCTEAWVRNPTTVGVPPLPGPAPTPPPTPTPPPVPPTPPPDVHPTLDVTLTGSFPTLFGHQTVTLTGKAVPETRQLHALRVKWLQLAKDLFQAEMDGAKLYADIASGNVAQAAADAQALLAEIKAIRADLTS